MDQTPFEDEDTMEYTPNMIVPTYMEDSNEPGTSQDRTSNMNNTTQRRQWRKERTTLSNRSTQQMKYLEVCKDRVALLKLVEKKTRLCIKKDLIIQDQKFKMRKMQAVLDYLYRSNIILKQKNNVLDNVG